jgi:LEA14-like dessication related protein
MNLNYEGPCVELVSLKVLPANGFEQNFEIGLKLTNPNNFDIPLNGISYQLSVAGETLVHSRYCHRKAYGESSFAVPVSTSLMGGIKVIRALMVSKGQNISYQLPAKLDIAIRFVPKLTVIQDGMITLGQKSQ